jgi:hypothetical protein
LSSKKEEVVGLEDIADWKEEEVVGGGGYCR